MRPRILAYGLFFSLICQSVLVELSAEQAKCCESPRGTAAGCTTRFGGQSALGNGFDHFAEAEGPFGRTLEDSAGRAESERTSPSNQPGSFGDYQGLSDAFGTGRGASGGEAGMIGDFFGGGYSISTSDSQTQSISRSSVPIAAGDRRFKIAENNSPFPTDRLMASYNHFANALVRPDNQSANLDRYMLGLEKTFWEQSSSIELRVPIVTGLSSDQLVNGLNSNFQSTEFGNIGIALKRRVFQGDALGASLGLGIITPTADDARVFDAVSNGLISIVKNDAIYLQPFVGFSYRPDEQLFAQLVMQTDFDTRGNQVFTPDISSQRMGVIQDQVLMYLDWSVGYWLLRNPGARVSGLAPMLELHYTTTLQDTDVVQLLGGGSLTNSGNRVDALNLTSGVRVEFFDRTYLTTAVVVPLRDGDDKLFDAELGVQLVRLF